MAQAVKQFGEIEVEIAQKRIHADHIGERNPQVAAVFVYPAFQRGFLEVAQPHVQRLKSLQKFVRHGADGGDAEFFRQIDIAGAAENIGCSLMEAVDDMLLPCKGVTAAGTEIGH